MLKSSFILLYLKVFCIFVVNKIFIIMTDIKRALLNAKEQRELFLKDFAKAVKSKNIVELQKLFL